MGKATIKFSYGALVDLLVHYCCCNLSGLYPSTKQNIVDVFSTLLTVLARVPDFGSRTSSAELCNVFVALISRQKIKNWPGQFKARHKFPSKLPTAYTGWPLA